MILVSSYFTEASGTSSCIVQHNGELYAGSARVHPEDGDKVSRFAGCQLAELRAEIKALKVELKQERMKCNEIRNFVKACSQYKAWNKDDTSVKIIYKQLNIHIKKVNNIIDAINGREMEIMRLIGQRDAVIKAIDRKKRVKNH